MPIYPLSEFRKKRRFVGLKRAVLSPVAKILRPLTPSPRPFEVTQHPMQLAKLRSPVKLVQLSDLHLGAQLEPVSVRNWVDACLAESPDLIVITGDVLDYTARGLEAESLRGLSRLEAPLGVWAVWGNQDYIRAMSELKALRERLESYGIRVLVNESVNLREDITLSGLDDILEGEPELGFLSAASTDRTHILLGHSPDVLPLLPKSIDLALFGHTHGGQIRLPFLGVVETSSRYGHTFLEGWVSQRAYVSHGLGTTGLPLRIGVSGELAVFNLSKEHPSSVSEEGC